MKTYSKLYQALTDYCAGDTYPFHMPGHKRRLGHMDDPYSFDITEIDGFDDLHHADGILREAMDRAAQLYGAEESYYLVNGSTAGILTAISAAAAQDREKKEIIIARNSHRAAWHALYLNDLEPVCVYPQPWAEPDAQACANLMEESTLFGGGSPLGSKIFSADGEPARTPADGEPVHFRAAQINGRIGPEAVEEALAAHPHACAVFLTSPTYDGVVSDVRRIACICHRAGVPLIVDEAHGAHFGFHPDLPDSSVHCGADLVIHSVHKTLPSLTQTALLHRTSQRVDPRLVQRFLDIYQTSSPSYVLMASMDNSLGIMKERGQQLLCDLLGSLQRFDESLQDLRILYRIRTDDPTKILISGANALSGPAICAILRRKYQLEPEMCAPSYVLALTSVGDDEEGLVRLSQALRETDEELFLQLQFPERRGGWIGPFLKTFMQQERGGRFVGSEQGVYAPEPDTGGFREETSLDGSADAWVQRQTRENAPQRVLSLKQAWDGKTCRVPLEESGGRISAEYVYLYPPGIPLLLPGERIRPSLAGRLASLRERGYGLQGMADRSMRYILVIDEQEHFS